MLIFTYKNKAFEVLKVEGHPFSFGSGLTFIDNKTGLKITCKDGEVFYYDQKDGTTYLPAHIDQ